MVSNTAPARSVAMTRQVSNAHHAASSIEMTGPERMSKRNERLPVVPEERTIAGGQETYPEEIKLENTSLKSEDK